MTTEPRITEAELDELVSRMDEAAAAYIRGDIYHYVSLFDHADDYTLMPPYGGETRRGFELTEESAAETSRFFASGEASLELQQSYVSVGAADPLRPFRSDRPWPRRLAVA